MATKEPNGSEKEAISNEEPSASARHVYIGMAMNLRPLHSTQICKTMLYH